MAARKNYQITMYTNAVMNLLSLHNIQPSLLNSFNFIYFGVYDFNKLICCLTTRN